MKIAFLIGGLGRGGTEAQLMRLAKGLQTQGVEVEVWCYAKGSDLDTELEQLGITVRVGSAGSQRQKVRLIRQWIAEFRPDVMHGFMKRASSLAVLANFASRKEVGRSKLGSREGAPSSNSHLPSSPAKRVRIMGSDLSTATYAPWRLSLWPSLVLFGFADVVVTQTELNRRSLERLAPWLRGKVRVIRNGIDLSLFCPALPREVGSLKFEDGGDSPAVPEEAIPNSKLPASSFSRDARPFRFAVVGSVYGVKNPVRLVEAVALLKGKGVINFQVNWYGRLGLGKEAESGSAEYHQAQKLIRENELEEMMVFQGETAEVAERLYESDALIHPSLQEGFPNAVVEAMACSLPLVVSRVSDLPLVVETAKNGVVVDQKDAVSIAEGMRKVMETGEAERRAMGERSRKLSEEWFGLERFVEEYVELYQELCNRRI